MLEWLKRRAQRASTPDPLISQAIPMAQPEPAETPSNPAPILSVIVPTASSNPDKLEATQAALVAVEGIPATTGAAMVTVEVPKAKQLPLTELERLEGNYRALYRRLDTPDQPGGAYVQLRDITERIRRLSPAFDFTALHLEEGATPMAEPVPAAQERPAGTCRTCGGLERWRSVRYREPWKCLACHPSANPEAVERVSVAVETEGAAWDEEAAYLIAWLATALPPSEPFALSGAQWVSDPALWLSRLREEAARGPKGPRARSGALQDDVRAFYRLVNSEAAGALPGSEE